MDEDIKNLLQQNLEVSQKTLGILKAMRRETWWARIFHAIKMLVLIGLLVFAFFKLQPYLEQWMKLLDVASQNIQKFNGVFK